MSIKTNELPQAAAMADSDSFDLNNPRTTEGYTEQEIYDETQNAKR